MTIIEELIDWVETRDMRDYQNKYAFKQGVLAKLNQAIKKEKQVGIRNFADGMQKEFNIFYEIAKPKEQILNQNK